MQSRPGPHPSRLGPWQEFIKTELRASSGKLAIVDSGCELHEYIVIVMECYSTWPIDSTATHATIVVATGLLSTWYASQVAGNKIRHMHGKALRGVKEPMNEDPSL